MVLDRGFAYQAGGSVYFDVSKFPSFGSISNYSHEQMIAFARERGGNVDDPHKRHPLDFVLWHPSAADEPSWDTMWGPGRPGWHIECSAPGAARAGHHHRPARWRHRPDLPASRVRAGPERGGDGGAVRSSLDAHVDGVHGRRTRCRRASATWCSSTSCARSGTRERSAWRSSSTTTALDWEWDDTLMPRNAERLAELVCSGPLATLRSTTFARALDDDLDTPGALAAIDAAVAAGHGVGAAAALLGVDI